MQQIQMVGILSIWQFILQLVLLPKSCPLSLFFFPIVALVHVLNKGLYASSFYGQNLSIWPVCRSSVRPCILSFHLYPFGQILSSSYSFQSWSPEFCLILKIAISSYLVQSSKHICFIIQSFLSQLPYDHQTSDHHQGIFLPALGQIYLICFVDRNCSDDLQMCLYCADLPC